MSVRRHISSNISQNRETFASSSGASTSSKTQIGAGFAKKTAKISANAVKVCSPPDSSDRVDSFFPGGWHIISSPASKGSSLSTITRLASPPPNKCLNNVEKFTLTCSNAVRSLSRPSRFKDAMPFRSDLIASSRSVLSPSKLSCSACTSFISSSARKLTAPRESRCLLSLFTSISIFSEFGNFSGSLPSFFSNSSGVACSSSRIRSTALSTVSCAASLIASARALCSRKFDANRSASRSSSRKSRKIFSAPKRSLVASFLFLLASDIDITISSRRLDNLSGSARAFCNCSLLSFCLCTNSKFRFSAVSKRYFQPLSSFATSCILFIRSSPSRRTSSCKALFDNIAARCNSTLFFSSSTSAFTSSKLGSSLNTFWASTICACVTSRSFLCLARAIDDVSRRFIARLSSASARFWAL